MLGVAPAPSENWAGWINRTAGPITVAELLLLSVILALALLRPELGRAFFARVERGVAAAARAPAGRIAAIGVLALAARALFLPWLGPPVPITHDEHSLILQAQTYLAGRLVNPTPPFWEHFESIHINLFPAYASMYFPGRGVPPALGLLIADHPWVGVWLTFILMCMAAVWMLRAWVSARLALLGGVLVVLRLGVFSYWVNSYWGGAFTALGGMLILGAYPRVLRGPGWRDGLLMGLGVLILMTTRPFEGLLVCAPLGLGLLIAMLRARGYPFGRMFVRVGAPVAGLAALGAVTVLAYHGAATGDVWTSPYDLNRQAYAITPAFLTAAPIEGERRGPAYFREFYKWEDIPYARRNAPSQIVRGVAAKLYYSFNFYVGLILAPAFLAGLWATRRRYVLPATLGFFFLFYAFETWNFPHYTAPIFAVVLVVTMKGFERLRTWRFRGRESGLFLTRAMPAALLAVLLIPASTAVSGRPALVANGSSLPCCALQQETTRSKIAARLKATPGRDLVLVAGDVSHPVHGGIVYNDPVIEGSPIVWAYRLGPEKDAALRAFHAGRRVWRLDWIEGGGYRLTPEPPAPQRLPG